MRTNVRFGSLADISGCPLYPQKRTLLIVGINVCYVPKADISIRRRTDS